MTHRIMTQDTRRERFEARFGKEVPGQYLSLRHDKLWEFLDQEVERAKLEGYEDGYGDAPTATRIKEMVERAVEERVEERDEVWVKALNQHPIAVNQINGE